MRTTLLISDEEIKNQSLIEMNVATKSIRVILKDVQHNQLRKIIGNDKYYSILTEVDNSLLPIDSIPVTGATFDLIKDYIQPFLVAAVCVDFLVLNSFKLTNKGILQMNDNNANSVGLEGLEHLKNYYDNKLAVAKMDLIEHLKTDDNCSSSKSNTSSSITGLYIESYDDFSDYFNKYNGRNKYL
jgi:hypothetical protein